MKYLEDLVLRYPALEACKESIEAAYRELETCFSRGGSLYIAGNGGSCADAQHIVGELMKGFLLPRKPSREEAEALKLADPKRGEKLADKLQRGLPAFSLGCDPALETAYLNDVEGAQSLNFAQALYGRGKAGDLFWGISTSGNSENVMNAAVVARALGMKVLALTGADGGALGRFADCAVKVPARETYLVQELHLPVYHCLCLMLEERFFIPNGKD